MPSPIPWHQLFGLSLVDFFRDEPVLVELEKDLSIKQQLLDLVIIRKGEEAITKPLADGFEPLATHNLVTFKSHRDTLDDWALEELIGHYVNYRKQVSPTMQSLLPTDDFKLFGLCVHSPRELFRHISSKSIQPGVYEIVPFRKPIRVIVIRELPKHENNALMHLFSGNVELLEYGATHYRIQSEETSTLLMQLFQGYGLEIRMPMTLKELKELTIRELLESMPLEKRLEGVPAEKRLEGLSTDEILRGLSEEAQQGIVQRLMEQGKLPKPNPN